MPWGVLSSYRKTDWDFLIEKEKFAKIAITAITFQTQKLDNRLINNHLYFSRSVIDNPKIGAYLSRCYHFAITLP